MIFSHEIKEGNPSVSILHVGGKVDASNYLELIEQAKNLINHKTPQLLINMEECNFLSSAGLLALLNIALIAHKIDPYDPEEGWSSLRAMANFDRELKTNFKLVNVQPNVFRTLDISGLASKYDIYSNMDDAMAAFKPISGAF